MATLMQPFRLLDICDDALFHILYFLDIRTVIRLKWTCKQLKETLETFVRSALLRMAPDIDSKDEQRRIKLNAVK